MARDDEDDGRDGWGGRGMDRGDDDEQRRMRGRPIDEAWSGRAGFANEREESRLAQRFSGAERSGRTDRGYEERLGMNEHRYAGRFGGERARGAFEGARRFFDDDQTDGGDDAPWAADRAPGDERYRRTFWGAGERGPSSMMRDRDDRDRGYGSYDRQVGDQSRWESGRFVDRRPFGAIRSEPYRGPEPYRGELYRGSEPYRGEMYRGSEPHRGGEWYRSETYRPEVRGDRHEQGSRRQGMGASIIDEVKSFFGRGPKSYARSDERIREDVCDRLTDDPSIDATHVEVEVTKGEVRLAGFVMSRFEKRRAEDIVDDVYGVRDVQNQLRVQREPQPSPQPHRTSTMGGSTHGEHVSIAGSPGGGATDAGSTTSSPMSSSTVPTSSPQGRSGPNGTQRR